MTTEGKGQHDPVEPQAQAATRIQAFSHCRLPIDKDGLDLRRTTCQPALVEISFPVGNWQSAIGNDRNRQLEIGNASSLWLSLRH